MMVTKPSAIEKYLAVFTASAVRAGACLCSLCIKPCLYPAISARPTGALARPKYIIYLSDENDNQDLYRIDVSGENKLQLTSSGYTDDTPTLTSYDNKILYISEKDGVREIYIMEVDGTGETRLTFNEGYSYHPSFSNH